MATGANTIPLGRLHPVLAAKMATQNSPPPPSKSSAKPPSPPAKTGAPLTMSEMIPATAMGGLLPTPYGAPTPVYQPPPPNPVAVGASKAASVVASLSSSAMGSKDPELKKHLEAAKRAASALFPEEPARKKRKSRWGSETVKTAIPGLPTVLPANMNEQQQKIYILHLKIEEASRMLRTGDLGIPLNPTDRSPSPEPIYSHDGKRLNTREVRKRKELEDQRHEYIQEAITLNPDYKPPADYKAPNRKFEDKVFIPQDHHPETNFVGLLIGPRGNTLKQLERESNTKIMIRGKGATKEGKFGRFGLPQPGDDEDLHALITGQTPEAVKVAVDKIKAIVQSGIDVPGNDNEIKKLQLMQLAELNGTFKPIDVLRCNNCGSSAHRTWQCTEQLNVTSSIICSRCGGGGHLAQDCKTDLSLIPLPADKEKMDSEYISLMKELGEKVPEHTELAAGTKTGVGVGTRIPPPMSLIGGNNPRGLHMEDPQLQPGPQPLFFQPPPGHFIPGGPPPLMQPGPPGVPQPLMMMPPEGMQPMPWGMAPGPHLMGPDGVPLMGAPPPPPPGSGPTPPLPTEGSEPQPNPPPQPWQAGGAQWAPEGFTPPPPPPPASQSMAAPPPPPPDQNWAGAPPPPPPPPGDA